MLKYLIMPIIMLLLTYLNCTAANAVLPTFSTVYRVDSRAPADIISAGGFTPWRRSEDPGNLDLVAHVEGISVESHTSSFVSASERIEGALRTLGESAFQSGRLVDPNFHSYLYEIRPSPISSYQVSGSLQAAATLAQNRNDGYRAALLRNLDSTLNFRIFEVATIDGFSDTRIIRYAEVTADMLRETALASMFTPAYWTTRWQPFTTYSHSYDSNTTSAEPYLPTLMSNPDGRGFVAENPNIEESMSPVTMGCFGICMSCTRPSKFTTPAKCNTIVSIRYFPYSPSLQLFLVASILK